MTMATTPAAAVARIQLSCIFSDEEAFGGHKVASWASVNVDLGTLISKIEKGNPPTKVSRVVGRSLLHLNRIRPASDQATRVTLSSSSSFVVVVEFFDSLTPW